MTSLDTLPAELLHKILKYIDPEDHDKLLEYRLVCRAFRDVIGFRKRVTRIDKSDYKVHKGGFLYNNKAIAIFSPYDVSYSQHPEIPYLLMNDEINITGMGEIAIINKKDLFYRMKFVKRLSGSGYSPTLHQFFYTYDYPDLITIAEIDRMNANQRHLTIRTYDITDTTKEICSPCIIQNIKYNKIWELKGIYGKGGCLLRFSVSFSEKFIMLILSQTEIYEKKFSTVIKNMIISHDNVVVNTLRGPIIVTKEQFIKLPEVVSIELPAIGDTDAINISIPVSDHMILSKNELLNLAYDPLLLNDSIGVEFVSNRIRDLLRECENNGKLNTIIQRGPYIFLIHNWFLETTVYAYHIYRKELARIYKGNNQNPTNITVVDHEERRVIIYMNKRILNICY